MVDEYIMAQTEIRDGIMVQIPLWSMNTSPAKRGPLSKISSDSSMVDEYEARIIAWLAGEKVQIPLWSMNTGPVSIFTRSMLSSDSSMVDEYRAAGGGEGS